MRFGTVHVLWSTSLVALTAITLRTSAVRADDDSDTCKASTGVFSSKVGEPCLSPIGLCTHGQLLGELAAKYDFEFLTLVPSNDATDPTKFVYTGTSVVTLNDNSGVLFTKDTGIIHIPLDGAPAQFVTKAIVDRGTKHLRHTLGGFVATGSITFETGDAIGNYSAILCPHHSGH